MKLVSVVGARPQFIKIAPLCRALHRHKKKIKHVIIHTGQHYDYNMSKIFFDELKIPKPDYHLGVGSGSHGEQTGKILKRTEKVLFKENPDCVIVYGDTNSTLAGALASTKLHIPVAHVEAGLRSYNDRMPEEINRVLTDHCSRILFCPTKTAIANLKKEGFQNIVDNGRLADARTAFKDRNLKYPLVINVGDIMYDALLLCLKIAEKKSNILERLKLQSKSYYLATVHRAENTDDKNRLKNILDALCEIGKNKPVIFPMHPRTRKMMKLFRCTLSSSRHVHTLEPLSYFDMLILEKNAGKILTDSGGLQKEAYFLRVPCITLRNETEWKETLKNNWNIIAGINKEAIFKNAVKILEQRRLSHQSCFGEGKTAERIVAIFMHHQNV